jgi:hypothetical protein
VRGGAITAASPSVVFVEVVNDALKQELPLRAQYLAGDDQV